MLPNRINTADPNQQSARGPARCAAVIDIRCDRRSGGQPDYEPITQSHTGHSHCSCGGEEACRVSRQAGCGERWAVRVAHLAWSAADGLAAHLRTATGGGAAASLPAAPRIVVRLYGSEQFIVC